MKKNISVILAVTCAAVLLPMNVKADEWVKKGDGYVYKYDDGTTAEKGWLKLDGKTYYIQKDGTRKTGWLKMKNDKNYYFNEDGTMYTGWMKSSKGNYYFDKNGVMKTGYAVIGKKIYRFDSAGLLKEQVKNKLIEIDGKIYYCLKDGSLAKGIVDIPYPDGNITAYFGDNGYSVSCKKVIDGVTYVFDAKKGLIDSYIAVKTTVHADVNYKGTPAKKTKGDWSWGFPSAECRKGSLYYNVDCIAEFENKMNVDIRITAFANIFDDKGYLVENRQISDVKLWSKDKYKSKKTIYLDCVPSKIEITEINVYFI